MFSDIDMNDPNVRAELACWGKWFLSFTGDNHDTQPCQTLESWVDFWFKPCQGSSVFVWVPA